MNTLERKFPLCEFCNPEIAKRCAELESCGYSNCDGSDYTHIPTDADTLISGTKIPTQIKQKADLRKETEKQKKQG